MKTHKNNYIKEKSKKYTNNNTKIKNTFWGLTRRSLGTYPIDLT